MSTILLDTRDLGEAEAVLSANFAKTRIKPPPTTSVSMRIERSFVGSIGVDVAEQGCDFEYDMEGLEQILLCRVVSGGLEQRLPRRPAASYKPGEVSAFGAVEGLPFSGRVERGRYEQLVVERKLLNDVAAGPGEAPVRLTGSRPVSEAANRQLFDAIEYVRRSADSQYANENRLIARELERHVATLLLATFPHTALLEPTIADRHDSTPVLLRRAMAFIDDNAHTDISLADIARAVYVTPRALQYMFRKHLECTPTDYLRRVRLHNAHQDLVAGNRGNTTVAEVARRWGFGHLGRFAVHYREHYGQSPHLSLRN
jgi:AraC-like DNA-binding protein